MIWILIVALVTLAVFIAAGIDDNRAAHRDDTTTPDRHRHRKTTGGNE